MRILIADDHPTARRYIREALEEEGWEVCEEAANGREAVGMTAELKPDIVVLDLCMPEVNGLEAAMAIHKEFPDTEIFILTMHDASELTAAALASGARACLPKHELSRLIDVVRGYNSEMTSEALR
jgi:DNA-binding NarL/FixJ family response regulator